MVTLGPVQPSLLPLPPGLLCPWAVVDCSQGCQAGEAGWELQQSSFVKPSIQLCGVVTSAELRGLREVPRCCNILSSSRALGSKDSISHCLRNLRVEEETDNEALVCSSTLIIKNFAAPGPCFLQREVQVWSKYVSLSLNIDLVFFSDLLLKGFLSHRWYSRI